MSFSSYDIVRSAWKHAAVLTHGVGVAILSELMDAAYFLVDDNIDIVLWLNENLVKEFQWQDDPAITHPDVHLGGELSIFWPDWSHECCVPNGCSREELLNLVDEFVSKEK